MNGTIHWRYCLFFILLFGVNPLWGIERVRVEPVQGVPMILVDGRPVRSRIFWGGQTRGIPKELSSEWQDFSIVFTSSEDAEKRGTLHLRFSHEPGEIRIDDLSITDVETGKIIYSAQSFEDPQIFAKNWYEWPKNANDSVGKMKIVSGMGYQQSGGLVVQLTKPPRGTPWPDYHIYLRPQLDLKEGKQYRLFLRAMSPQKLEFYHSFYRPGARFTLLGNDDTTDYFSGQIKMAAQGGVNFISFPIECPWSEPGKTKNWSSVDKVCKKVLLANPNALLLPRVGMEPPLWWKNAHPDHMTQWKGNPNPSRKVVSVSSSLYRKDASAALFELVQHLEETFGPHFAGIHPCGQNTGEWFYIDSWRDCYTGYAPCDRIAWRQWLVKKYESDTLLQQAWGQANVTRSTADVPDHQIRLKKKKQLYLDPSWGSDDRWILDFNEFQQDMMIDTVLDFAHAARTGSAGKKMVLIFYGYLFEFGALENGPSVSGHYALTKALRSPDVDIWCSPISYYDRRPGGTAAAMTAAESVLAAGKLWLYEDDTRTYLALKSTFPGSKDGGKDRQGTIELLLRNTAQCAVRNFGTWWMDLGSSGWHHDQHLWDEMKKLDVMDQWFLDHPTSFKPEIAALIDEQSAMAAPNNRVTRKEIYEIRSALARIGAPFGQYLLRDYLSGTSSALLNVFVNPTVLSTKTRQDLIQKTRDTISVWGFASGYLDERSGRSLDAMKELTGFAIEKTVPPKNDLIITEAGKDFGLATPWGKAPQMIHSDYVFVPKDAKPDEVLMRYANGLPAVAIRKISEKGYSLFVGVPGMNTELLRGAARLAGVHLFTESDCNVYANGPFIILHGAQTGNLTLNLRREAELCELFSEKSLGIKKQFDLLLEAGKTKLFRIKE